MSLTFAFLTFASARHPAGTSGSTSPSSALLSWTDEPKQTKDVNVALAPLGMPLPAGPGAIVSVILAEQKAHSIARQVSAWAVILAIHLVLWLVMR